MRVVAEPVNAEIARFLDAQDEAIGIPKDSKASWRAVEVGGCAPAVLARNEAAPAVDPDLDALERAARAAKWDMSLTSALFEAIASGRQTMNPKAARGVMRDCASAVNVITEFLSLISENRVLQERVEGAEARDEWQPIETAPKDGFDILAYGEAHGHRIVSWTGWFNNLSGRDEAGFLDTFSLEHLPELAHWRPLPEPPARTKAGEPHEQE